MSIWEIGGQASWKTDDRTNPECRERVIPVGGDGLVKNGGEERAREIRSMGLRREWLKGYDGNHRTTTQPRSEDCKKDIPKNSGSKGRPLRPHLRTQKGSTEPRKVRSSGYSLEKTEDKEGTQDILKERLHFSVHIVATQERRSLGCKPACKREGLEEGCKSLHQEEGNQKAGFSGVSQAGIKRE